ncbi:MAG: dienelactone hydrolase family protein [Alphaproteobacteria bacterium]|nr:dienelactone hydrolase family protein [Alphaproteobacteria bacterium]
MGETIELKAADGHTLSAYRAGDAAGRGLVVVQEIFGVNHHIRNVCDRFAAAGYQAIAPALFDRAQRGIELGYTQEGIAHGREWRGKLTDEGVLADIAAAAEALGGGKRGIVGYCFGGTVAWWGATRTELFAAAVGWYGGAIAATRTAHPHCPVQLHFGETDASIPLADVEAIRAAQPGVEIYLYPGAGHGFGCDERQSFNPEAAKLAQSRTLAFFARHLV